MTLVPIRPDERRLLEPTSWSELVDYVEMIANTDFVPKSLRGNPPAILAAVLTGREIGLQTMASLANIAVIDGKPTLSAQAMRSLILADGHEFLIEESTASRATVAGRRRDGRTTHRVTWTLDKAKRAQIAGRPAWQRYPEAMLKARATSELARDIFPDVIGGFRAREEFDVIDLDEADVVEQAEPKPATTTRRRRKPSPASSSSSQPAAPAEPPHADSGDEAHADEPIETVAGPPPFEPPAEAEAEPEPAPPDPITEAQFRRMFALFAERGFDRDDRARRHAYSERILGRPIESSRDLSALDGSRIIEALEAGEGLEHSAEPSDDQPAEQAAPAATDTDPPEAAGLPPDEQAVLDEARRMFDATEADQ